MTQTQDGNAVLMGGGASAKAWKFEETNTTRVGQVLEPPRAVQERDYDPRNPGGGEPKFFPSGDPIMGVHVTMQGNERDPMDPEDDGRRTFYCEGRYLKEAVRNAVKDAGADGLEVGGTLRVTFTHREDPTDKRSRKYWTVQYTPAGNAALMAPSDPEAQFGPSSPAQDPWAGQRNGNGNGHAVAAQPTLTPPPPPAPAAPVPPAAAPVPPAGPVADPIQVLGQIKALVLMGLPDQAIAQALGVDHAAVAAVRNLPV